MRPNRNLTNENTYTIPQLLVAALDHINNAAELGRFACLWRTGRLESVIPPRAALADATHFGHHTGMGS